MLKNQKFVTFCLLTGLLLAVCGFILQGLPKQVSAALVGIGSGLFGLSLSSLITNYMERKNPALKKQNEIELKDERNIMIRQQAQAKAGTFLHWLVLAFAWVLILLDFPLCLILLSIGIYLAYYIFYFFCLSKYGKEM